MVMDDFKIIFWIILGLIYLFTRKKKTAPPPARPRQNADDEYETTSVPKPTTFEDLLREIQQAKGAREVATETYDRPPSTQKTEFVDYDDQLEDEKKDLEDTAHEYGKEDKIYEVYEDAKKLAFYRPSLEETLKLEDTIVRFKQFKGYETTHKQTIAEEYLKDLRDPQGIRKAFILSEILNRRF